MDLKREKESREKFRAILYELSESQENLQDAGYRSNMYKRLENLYDAPIKEERFRHFYSDIFSVLTDVKQNPDLGDINILGQNLDIIRNGYKPKTNVAADGREIDISDAINKLYDHVNLDISRILYSEAGDWKLSGSENIKNLQAEVNEMLGEIDQVQNKIKQVQNNAEKKISNQQKEYIAILGIFASVVLAFMGGISFSTSVLDNIAQASIYRILMVGLTIGLVLVNVLFGLFYYIGKIVNADGKLKPMVISNAIILIMMLAVICAWLFGVVESRNTKISTPYSTQQIQNEPDTSAGN